MSKQKDKEIQILKQCLRDTLWMAGRYANRRLTYAPSMFNDALRQIDALGYQDLMKPDATRNNERYINENPESHD